MVSEKVPAFAVRVGGILLPKPLAGHRALELCNTLAGWADPPEHRKEWLTTPEHLAIWAQFTGLVTPRPHVTDAVLDDVRELRALAYRLLGHRDGSAFPAFAEVADEANARTRLTRADDGSAAFRLPPVDDPEQPPRDIEQPPRDLEQPPRDLEQPPRDLDRPTHDPQRPLHDSQQSLRDPQRPLHNPRQSLPNPRQPLHAAALAVADLLGRPERLQVRVCPGEGCGWLFLDPRGRRTWCTMAVCGNRAKVRAHAARRRSDEKP